MTSELATLALALLATLGFAAATSLVALPLWPLCRRLARHGHPRRRARLALGFALAPTVVPLALVGLCLLPGIASSLGLAPDHCPLHREHAHLCFAHATLALTTPLAAALVLCVGVLAVAGVRGAGRLARARRELAAQPQEPARALGPDVRLLRCERPFALTVGLWRPRIWVSSGMLEALSPRQLAAVLEHERCHLRRRDALRRLLAAIGSLPHLPPLRRALRAELALASEQVCDEAAGQRLGDRLLVAEAILRLERLLARVSNPRDALLAAFDGSAVAARVQGLVAPDRAEPSQRRSWWLAPTVVTLVIAGAEPLHHATEHVLGVLLRWL